MRRALVLLSLIVGVVSLRPASAGATVVTASGPGCSPFGHVQTYEGWGPARFYGKTVTVRFAGPACVTATGHEVQLSLQGTATVHAGRSTSGPVLETRAFRASGTWTGPGDSSAWSPPWWQCGVGAADYRWEIPGVYSFVVAARDGQWTLNVSATGKQPQSVHWSHDAC